jgi:hypothetical protein
MSHFVIVGTLDNPLFEAEFGTFQKDPIGQDNKHINQFVIHAALDIVDELIWTTNSLYLKVVDRFNELNVSAYVLPSGARFMLLHEQNGNDNIKHFFQDCHELYIKVTCG